MTTRIIIDGVETNYTITDDGCITNIITKQILKGYIAKTGYRVVQLSINKNKKKFYVHRLVAQTFLNTPSDNSYVVNHIDGNKLNNKITNLEWVTRSQNVQHAIDTGLTSRNRHQSTLYTNDLLDEEWVSIKGYDGLYEISNYGRVKSLYQSQPIILRPSCYNEYEKVYLSKDNQKKQYFVHRLVFEHFGEEILEDGYCVDHIDGNKLNNHINNLRKVSLSENTIAAYYEQNAYKKQKEIIAYKDGVEIGHYTTFAEAGQLLNCDPSGISKCCKGKLKQIKGYTFICIEK